MIKNHAIASRQKLVIKAGRTEQQYWQDIWKYRELFYFLAWRDILVHYKQTTIGLGVAAAFSNDNGVYAGIWSFAEGSFDRRTLSDRYSVRCGSTLPEQRPAEM